MKWKMKLGVVVLSLLLGVSGGLSTFAEDSTTTETTTSTTQENPNAEVSYSVAKIPSDKEKDTQSSFFDLVVEPGDEFTIQAKMFNSSNEDMSVKSVPLTTFTNINGEIAYSSLPPEEGFDESLTTKFSEIATVESAEVDVPKASQVVTTTTIKIPADAKEGVILGSWYFEKMGQTDDEGKASEGISIKNQYSYAMAVKITVKNEIAKPNLNFLKVEPDLNSYRKVINGYVQNDQAAIISQLTFSATVTKKGSKDVLYSNDAGEATMAPNSNFPYPVFLGEDQLAAGEYTYHLKATTKDPKWEETSWEWSQDFTIKADEAKKINEAAFQDPQPSLNIWWIIGGLLLLFIIILIIVWQVAKRKYQKQK